MCGMRSPQYLTDSGERCHIECNARTRNGLIRSLDPDTSQCLARGLGLPTREEHRVACRIVQAE